jgi:hypothetical protein
LTIKPGAISEFRRMEAYYLGIRQDNIQNMDQGLLSGVDFVSQERLLSKESGSDGELGNDVHYQ